MDKRKRLPTIKWESVSIDGDSAGLLQGFVDRSSASFNEGVQPKSDLRVPDLSGLATPLEKADYLLRTATAIEHSLMVQYLYAMYSLRSDNDPDLSSKRKASIRRWRRGIREVAVEEMQHLIMAEVMLMMLGQLPDFERDGIDANVNPFAFHLEPLTRESLAKYVITESPPQMEDVDAVYKEAHALAKREAGMMINHVGILYAILGVVFSTPEEIASEPDADDTWRRVVREMAHCLYAKFPNVAIADWHLRDEDFQNQEIGETVSNDWGVPAIVDRASAFAALEQISVEGEGVPMDADESHFEKFFAFFQEFPAAGGWTPSRPVPTDPFVDEGSLDTNAIADADAARWAALSDHQYGLLLGVLQHYLYHEAGNTRDELKNWCVFGDGGMYSLSSLSDTLVTRDRGPVQGQKAALPFTVPDDVNLPTDSAERVAILTQLANTANALIDEIQSIGDTSDDSSETLQDIADANSELIALLQNTGNPDGNGVNAADDQAIIDLINAKTPQARRRHRSIDVELDDGSSTDLRQLFRDEDAEGIVAFLKSGTSVVDPYSDMPLVDPGKPDSSAFYLHIVQSDGIMSDRFTDDEKQVVRAWILGQASHDNSQPQPDVQPNPNPRPGPGIPPAAPDSNAAKVAARREMLRLIENKRRQGAAFHDGVDTPSGETLSELFASQRFEEVLAFLVQGTAIVSPFDGTQLIVPGEPNKSAFYLHLTDPDGAMSGKFRPDEVAVVKTWIESLAPEASSTDQSQAAKVHAPITIEPQEVASGFDKPLFAAAPPGDVKRLFIVEQRGTIKILRLNKGTVAPTPFLKIDGLGTSNEQGLLGLAFHPDYANNGRIFVNCTVQTPDGGSRTEIQSYTLASKDKVDRNSKMVVLSFSQPFRNHNAGWIGFGPKDGLLYIASGDGGGANDPHNNGQNLNSLLGKMLRINVDHDGFPGDDNRNYSIPPSNPFVNVAGARDEIWSYGLRNPWRCSFDRETADLFIGDVGQGAKEEINFQSANATGGENYGWNAREGTLPTGLSTDATGPFVDPILDYTQSDGISVIGGYVYRGSEATNASGTYFFADFTGRLWSTRYQPGSTPTVTDHSEQLTVAGRQIEDVTSFGEDANGELYVTSQNGSVYKLDIKSQALAASDWDRIAKIKIHPAIGIARVGNAGFTNGTTSTPADPRDFFVGPERPFETSPPVGGYKRNGMVRRQAARFRLYGFDANDELIGEITADDADISWSVELANKKASFRIFTGLQKSTILRNQLVPDDQRHKLEIKPGARTLNGPGQSAAFDNGTFSDFDGNNEHSVADIYLGEIQTESSGRLIVLPGEGMGQSPRNRPITSFVNNEGWYDTIADGPVSATVRLGNGVEFQAAPAWVITAPPKFAPSLRNVVTLYDVLSDRFVNNQTLGRPNRPSFRYDIFPILERAIMAKWIMAQASSFHDFIRDVFPPANENLRRDLFERLRHPDAVQNGPGMNMPMLFDDNNAWDRNGEGGLAFTDLMYEMLTQWADGDFVQDWHGSPPQPPSEITPEGLDRAALENCSGGGFFPGIEAGWMLRDDLEFSEPFRLDQTNLSAGDISRQMAVPWQADFYKCATANNVGWWPQQRPDDVFVEGSSSRVKWIRDKIRSHLDMVEKWHELGFVVDNGTRFVETERTP